MTRIDKYIVFSILNAILLVTVIFNTVINFYLFVLAIIILVVICNILIKKKIINIDKQGKKYFFGVTFPQIVNAFFLINYVTGMNPTQETYCFRSMVSEVGSVRSHQKGKTTYVYLSGNAYEYSYMTRSFWIDYKRMLFKNQVIYTFERGIFGLKIRKDFEFVFNENCLEK
ncbi:5-bromo-4-chloroindolyl phosphate hydrolysis protein [Chryseobacterium bernardetii]|jgi:hypothetical protein|uniref:Uncharacterized protein n=2 Tax=Chryseobacterium TaxID=59732 RepID=A0A543EB87_9FLAO|nr:MULTISPECIES: hypothetical protein [Chryseobacterium]MDR6371520.1 5-bromo-4-chloroindolyl phosphate hydrolysis protein [Chryseobacterium vietnamense]MDR6441975.1 5-bromo-4-chloroindolyl phosphate hydrolysis protein [Chryseobacterium bernardetii]MDR6488179.1 5-bromo-4-chloroindolyl phosphate hydrolysis protein [Chryseobacterium vietnamense]TQM18853.1 hypothetical protein FB551_3246 [Chryseobacterium aquifrigidense]